MLSECSSTGIGTTSLWIGLVRIGSGSARFRSLFVDVFHVVTWTSRIFAIFVIFIVYCVMLAFHALIVVTAPFELVIVLKVIWTSLSCWLLLLAIVTSGTVIILSCCLMTCLIRPSSNPSLTTRDRLLSLDSGWVGCA